jgi:hypothetical protein
MAVGPTGFGVIAYLGEEDGHLEVAACADLDCNQFTASTIDSTYLGDHGVRPSIAFGRDGLALISYGHGQNADSPASLAVAHCQNVTCTSATITTVDGVGTTGNTQHPSSLTIGADGLGVVSYPDTVNADLRVAHCSNLACSSATTTTVDTLGDVRLSSSIAILDGRPIISYHESLGGDLRVARCPNAACTGLSPGV